jgi:hypothetical protein
MGDAPARQQACHRPVNSTSLSSSWSAALHHRSHDAMYLFQIYPSTMGVPVCAQTLVGSPGKTVVQI